ncbi:hypothetical protein [Paenibacillus lautus]|nr:hypothetical protein [Paenibacillus lautus]
MRYRISWALLMTYKFYIVSKVVITGLTIPGFIGNDELFSETFA